MSDWGEKKTQLYHVYKRCALNKKKYVKSKRREKDMLANTS
jgi:hypothetical protein